jgi:hypothetical protein
MFKEVELPECLRKEVFEDDREYTNQDNVFHASELSYECMFKVYMDREHGKGFPDDARWNLYRGSVFDKAITPLFDENELRVQQRVKGTPYVIRGRIDGLNYDTNEIFEVKSVVSIKYVREPFKHHVPQGLFYLGNYNPEATLKFLYVSMDGYKVLEYTGGFERMEAELENFDAKARIIGKAIRKGEPPEPIRANECKWCRYKNETGELACPLVKGRGKQ